MHVFLLVLFSFVVNTVLVLLKLLREKVVLVVVVCFIPLNPRAEKIAVCVAVCVAIFIPKCNHEEDKDKEEDAARVVSFLREAFSITTQQRARVRERVRENEREQTWSSS